MIKTKLIPAGLLEPNKGQIKGLPKNPRLIKDDRFKKLVKSLQDLPEMAKLRECIVIPFQKKYVIIGGNQRYHAMKELKWEQIPCKELPSTTSVEKLREIVIKDNQSFGEDDWDELKEWDQGELEEWGMEIPELKTSKQRASADANAMSDQKTLALHFTQERYNKVKTQLRKIADTPEQAIWELLGNK